MKILEPAQYIYLQHKWSVSVSGPALQQISPVGESHDSDAPSALSQERAPQEPWSDQLRGIKKMPYVAVRPVLVSGTPLLKQESTCSLKPISRFHIIGRNRFAFWPNGATPP